MLFFAFFWAFFHSSLNPTIEIGCVWPPKGIIAINPWHVPLLNTVVLGISRDDLKSHGKFKDKYNLKFNLGSDIDGQTCSKYSVWVEKSMFGKKYMGVNRATFLINQEGEIAHIWPKVSVEGHAREVLDKIRKLSV